MAEASSVRGKTRAQINAQIDRIFNTTREAINNAAPGRERQRLRERYLRAGAAYERYIDNANSSPRMNAAIRRYIRDTGGLQGDIAGYLDTIVIPRSQYARRRNNRRG